MREFFRFEKSKVKKRALFILIFLLIILSSSVKAQLPESMDGCVDYGARNVFAKQSCYDYFIKSLDDCYKIQDSNTRFKDACFWKFAEESNNPDICIEMTNPNGCLVKLSSSLDESTCAKLTDEDELSSCYYTLALEKLESDICLKIPSINRQNFDPAKCIMEITVKTKNYKECEKLSSLSYSNKIQILDSCYFNYAQKVQTSDICKYIDKDDLRAGCYNLAGFGFNFYWLSSLFFIILVNSVIWAGLIMIYSYKKAFDKSFIKNKFKVFIIGLLIGLFFFFVFNIPFKGELHYLIMLIFLFLTMTFLTIPITFLTLIGLRGYATSGKSYLFPFASPFLIGVSFIFLWISFIFLLSYFKNNWEKSRIKIISIAITLLFIILNIYLTIIYWIGGFG